MTRRALVISLGSLVTLAVLVTAAVLYLRQAPQPVAGQISSPAEAMVRFHSPIIGPVAAPVTIVEFLDPACEACRAFYPHVKQILQDYPDQVRLVIRYVPFHGDVSVTAVKILEAARAQRRFEPVLDALMDSQPVWANHGVPAPARAWEFAGAAGLDLERARIHAVSGAAEKLLAQDNADLRVVGVRATPTFFVNGKPLPKPDPDTLRELVKNAVEGAQGAK